MKINFNDLEWWQQLDKPYIRHCDECGKEMWDGYCIGAGIEYYCSDECLHKHYTQEEWEEMYEDDGDNYYTEWYEEYSPKCFDANGNMILNEAIAFEMRSTVEYRGVDIVAMDVEDVRLVLHKENNVWCLSFAEDEESTDDIKLPMDSLDELPDKVAEILKGVV